MIVGLDRIFNQGIATLKVKGAGIAIVVMAGAGVTCYFSMSGRDDVGHVETVAATGLPLVRLEPLNARPPIGAGVLGEDGRPTQPSDPVSLAQALQAGLTWAECYDGPINGIWTGKSKDSMRRFAMAVNAQLRVDVPDQSLLALVESNHAAKCFGGQSASAASAGTRVAPPSLVSVHMQLHLQTHPEAAASQPPLNSPASGVSSEAGVPIEHVSASSKVIPSPIQMESNREAVVPSNESEAKLDLQTNSRSTSQPYNRSSQRQTRYKKPMTVDAVSKSITKSVKSIQRSLATLFQ